MPPSFSQPVKFAASAVVTAVVLFGILTWSRGPKLEVVNRVISVSDTDAEMNAAIARARATLPVFWASYAAPKASETEHSLKVRFQTGGNDEYIWVGDVQRLPGGDYAARLADTPRNLPGKQFGDLTTFKDADISDWMFMRNGKIVGGETIKPLLKSMPKADADALRARMEQP
ncbi:YegJ family protein [Bradyrhizobium sp. GCM10027634]|uniref:YegJ family protein n=1 Tax=unclassified Bradyrhizobium TaxID=2631580 RepID=UPI00188B53BA|nr:MULTISPECIES: DUF2314 domain-containing protein [unclassified Bradyrhizobium]MDN5003736.1 DUF2314 domain-containing protein [Bradyrhizobium sp. WYCCWR 12677]QOZ47736.1 hypothetical protein XH89_32825 [Bradyrhizobium sp. CCBAU 53340]